MAGPLDSLTVVDCTRGIAGPRATGLLADYGADVLWVEPPGGDPFRSALRTEYAVFNRGKRSVQLDLKSDAGRQRLFEHLAGADLFVTSWRPGVADRLGLDYDTLHARFPGLVYTSITGFGEDGTLADVPGHDGVVSAHVGVTADQVGVRPAPIYEALPFPSIGAAYLSLIGSLAALYRRDHDGVGRHVQTSLVDGALAYLGMVWGDSDDATRSPAIVPGRIRLISRSFRCADDEYLGVHTAAVGAFGRLMRVLGLTDRIPVAEDGSDMRQPLTDEQRVIVLEEIPAIFETEPRQVWLDRLLAADVCAIPELHPTEAFDEPQVRHNDMVLTVDDPELGTVEQVAPAARFRGFTHRTGSAAPRVGQHDADPVAPPRDVATESVATDIGQETLLAGVRILDAGAYYAGPFSSRLLADLGAEVIKLETTLGDQLRGIVRPFRSASAGKRAISVNLKDLDLATARDALLQRSDIVMHNMRPGAAERVGLGYEQVRALNPDAVYLYAPGWGSTGPDARRQSFAPLMSGYCGVSYEVAGQFNPPMWPLGNEDPGNGLVGAVAALVGLWQRGRGGQGCYIENPQLNATLNHLAHIVRRSDGTVLGAGRMDPMQLGVSPTDRVFETANGWICVSAVSDAELVGLTTATGVEIIGRADYATPELRLENSWTLGDELAVVFNAKSSDEWLAVLRGTGVAAVVAKTEKNNEAFHRDPANQRIGRIAEVHNPGEGNVREAALMVRVSHCQRAPHLLARDLGVDTDDVLREVGYSDQHIAQLRQRGSVR